jgi:predicted Co/Zn/Cd cation transporter (cation efflux family)
VGLSNLIISSIVPYSCWFLSMCCAKAEIFVQYIENRHLKQLLDSKNIIFYTRYVDDIFIIYDTIRTTADSIHNYINNIHNCLQLNPTYENNTQINFLDLCIIRKTNKL